MLKRVAIFLYFFVVNNKIEMKQRRNAYISTEKPIILCDMTKKILKISMKNKKNSMFSFEDIVYSVNINKKHGRKWCGEGRMFQ